MDDVTRLLRGRSQAEISGRGASGDGRKAPFGHRHPDKTRRVSRQPDRDLPSQLMRAGVSCLMLAAVACSSPIGPGDHVAVGMWGGEHVALDITADRGRIEYDCAHGDLAGSLEVDRGGRFDVTGTHTPEHGGPVRGDEKPISRPARYAGRVEGGRMTLTVTLTDTGDILGTFTLTQGVAGRLTKCL